VKNSAPFNWTGKTVLITGGTGTFGRAFAQHILQYEKIRALRILSRDELKQWEFARAATDERLRFMIGDVRELSRLLRAFAGVDVVIHAAALKQVPACEYNPFEAIKTNVVGAQNVIEAAIERGVERVLGLSTDKAANPVNLYGATKLCAEKLFVQGNAYVGESRTRFACVRYGNVVGSRGSVVPLVLEQRQSGRVTLTDRRMTRFWISAREAVDLVRRSVEAMRGGEVFVPKLPSIKVVDLIEATAPGCEIHEVGIRPGEKLHETLVTAEESRRARDGSDLFVIPPETPSDPATGWTDLPARSAEHPYASDTNDQWLAPAQIAALLPAALKDARHYEATSD